MVFCNNGHKNGNKQICCHNPYFNRWFSAMQSRDSEENFFRSHNPYFNRWFSAIEQYSDYWTNKNCVTILILIDGFLQ